MRNFLLILIILVAVPIVWFMGIKGLSWKEMLLNLGIKWGE